MQNLVTIPQRISFPRMRKIAHQRCLLGFFFPGFFQQSTAKAPEPIFTQNTSKDVVDLFVCPHPFMFPWAVESSPLQFLVLA